MQKVISINLNGNAYQLDESGYDALREYLTVAERELAINPDRAEILAWYRDRGWTSAAVETRVAMTPDRSSADVTQLVREGARGFFGKTIVRGNARARSSSVLPLRRFRCHTSCP